MSFKELLKSSGYSLSIMKKNKKVVEGNVDERVLFSIRQAKPLALGLPVLQDLSGLPPGWSSFMTRLGIPELVTLRNSDNGLNCFYQSISDAFSGKISLQQVRTLLANFVTPEDVKDDPTFLGWLASQPHLSGVSSLLQSQSYFMESKSDALVDDAALSLFVKVTPYGLILLSSEGVTVKCKYEGSIPANKFYILLYFSVSAGHYQLAGIFSEGKITSLFPSQNLPVSLVWLFRQVKMADLDHLVSIQSPG